MFRLQFAVIFALALLASCSSSSTPRGVSQTQEFNPTTSRWETTNRVVTTEPAQPSVWVAPASAEGEGNAQPVAEPEKEKFWKKPLKWIPGVN